MTQVVVTGLGCVSALGLGVDAAWARLLANDTGVSVEDVVAAGQPECSVLAPVARVRQDFEGPLVQRFGRKVIGAVDKFSNLAAAATIEAIDDAGLEAGSSQLRDAAILYATTTGGLSSIEAAYQRLFDARLTMVHPLTVPRLMGSGAVSHLSMLLGVRGLCYGIASACASSAHAIGEGMHLIRSGRAEVAIVGGSDASVTYGGVQAWRALQAVSDTACRPFSAGRDGTVLGEGAATLILESEAHARGRGARIYGELAGYGASADATHLTKPNAETAADAVRHAHKDAGLAFDTPLLISAHGTGTILNDVTETAVLSSVYGPGLAQSRVIATKAAHGHMLGAVGAMEFLLALLALQKRIAPPIHGYLAADPACDLPLVLAPESISYDAAISTSFAFGGLNCALIARTMDERRPLS